MLTRRALAGLLVIIFATFESCLVLHDYLGPSLMRNSTLTVEMYLNGSHNTKELVKKFKDHMSNSLNRKSFFQMLPTIQQNSIIFRDDVIDEFDNTTIVDITMNTNDCKSLRIAAEKLKDDEEIGELLVNVNITCMKKSGDLVYM